MVTRRRVAALTFAALTVVAPVMSTASECSSRPACDVDPACETTSEEEQQ